MDLVSTLKKKIVRDYDTLAKIVDAARATERKIAATIGSFDALHIGHLRYLIRAKEYGDILIVGADSDRAIKLYKGPKRPIWPEAERLEMLSYQVPVDWVTIIDDVDDQGRWQYKLLDVVRPDVFVAVEDSYPEEQRRDIERYCDKLVVLPRQAEETSSTDTFRKLILMLGKDAEVV
ncbi:MAG: hypothetical protein EXS68_01165 [Candidatus Ryanbacteria bacterium]|nr:hypothetical protein [Candidatus Ryanbacteria bacterium]